MKIVCIGDAFITCEMMEEGIRPYLTEGDTVKTLFFGLEDKTQMRDILKDVETISFSQRVCTRLWPMPTCSSFTSALSSVTCLPTRQSSKRL